MSHQALSYGASLDEAETSLDLAQLSAEIDTLVFVESEPAGEAASESHLDDFLLTKDPEQALHLWLAYLAPAEKTVKCTEDLKTLITREIAALDALLNEQVNHIIHHPKVQQLEASWRGLEMLRKSLRQGANTQLRFLDMTWAELNKDIARAIEFDQSQLFHKIYSCEFGMPGGTPFGVIIGDYQIGHRKFDTQLDDDITTLHGISQIAAAAFTPFITSINPEFFGLDNFDSLNTVKLEEILRQAEYGQWRAFRKTEDARFIGLTLPRILMRPAYTYRSTVMTGFQFKELCVSKNDMCWGNASYAFGTVLMREFSQTNWFAQIRGVPRDTLGGGLVDSIATDYFHLSSKQSIHGTRGKQRAKIAKPMTDFIVSDLLERRLSELGFITLCQCHNSPYTAFYSNQSAQEAPPGTPHSLNNTHISTMLQHILCASRIAHFIKVMVRDKTGSLLNSDQIERFLQRWLQNYTSSSDSSGWDAQARFPLRESAVSVRERRGQPGLFSSIIHLKPQYQLDEMVSEIKLTTELTQLGSI